MLKSKIRPFIVPIFLPQLGCRQRCVFCNQKIATGVDTKYRSISELSGFIDQYLSYSSSKWGYSQIGFYGGTFLGIPKDIICNLLDMASEYIKKKQVDSIRLSTRPETINKENLDLISGYAVKTIEIGAQSMDDKVLLASQRGHTSSDTENAVKLLKQHGYEVGLHMMVGLPDEDINSSIATAQRISSLLPDFVRIHPTLVLEGSPLAAMFHSGKYVPLTLEQAVIRTKEVYEIFQTKRIPVIRMGLQTSDSLNKDTILAGPFHPSFGHLVFSAHFFDKAVNLISQKLSAGKCSDITLYVNPKNISKIRGLNNSNTNSIIDRFGLSVLNICPDNDLDEYDIIIR